MILLCLPLILRAQDMTVSSNNDYIFFSFPDSVVVQSTDGRWKQTIKGAADARFTPDGETILFRKGDSLCRLKSRQQRTSFIGLATSYDLPAAAPSSFIAFSPKGQPEGELILYNLKTQKEKTYQQVIGFLFDASGHTLLLETSPDPKNDSSVRLQWISMADGKERPVWSGEGRFRIKICRFADEGRRLAMLMWEEREGQPHYSIWYYKAGRNAAQLILSDDSAGVGSDFNIVEDPNGNERAGIEFSKDGEKVLFFKKEKKAVAPVDTLSDKFDVWSYTDARLQSLQHTTLQYRRIFTAVVDVNNRQVIQLGNDHDVLLGSPNLSTVKLQFNDRYAMVCHFDQDVLAYDDKGGVMESYTMNEFNWNKALEASIYLVNLDDGSRKVLAAHIKPATSYFPFFQLSPHGKYVIYFDEELQRYLSYEIATGVTHEFVQDVATEWTKGPGDGDRNSARDFFQPRWADCLQCQNQWLGEDSVVLIVDRYRDVWKADPRGHSKAVLLDDGLGRRLGADSWVSSYYPWSAGISGNGKLLCAADDSIYFFAIQRSGSRPVFAVAAPASQQTDEGSARVTFTTLDGRLAQGILYKPSDFDPRKKYPVILQYYEGAGWGEAAAQFCDNGYLIFSPEIIYTPGETGESVYNCVVGAAKYIANYPFVDAAHMGIRGYSHGGFETNYLIAHAHVFAAAFSGAGVSDLFSYGGTEDRDAIGYNYLAAAEIGQPRIGVSPWERPDLYVKNSAVFYADSVTMPVLLQANKHDTRVPYAQGVEFFKALRRAGKRAWLLSGDEGGHGGYCSTIWQMEMQFFDHYLKGKPAPVWMTRGLPAVEKGSTYGMEYDSTMKTPGPGLLRDDEVLKMPGVHELLKHRTAVNHDGRIIDVDAKQNKN